MQTRQQKIYSLQLLRGIAAFLIAFGHIDNYVGTGNPTKGFAWVGIDLFFVISGFVIAYTVFPAVTSRRFAATFAVKRLARIYPTYWVFFALGLIVMLLTGYNASLPLENQLLSFILFPQRIAEQWIPVAWSLHFELWFYFMTMICVALLGQRWWIGILAWTAVVIAMQPFISYAPTPAYDYNKLCLGLYQLEFFSGFVAAWLILTQRIVMPGKMALLGLTISVGALLYGIAFLEHPQKIGDFRYFTERAILLSAGFGLLVYGLAGLEATGRWTRMPRFGVRLGDASYSLYLGHDLLYVTLGAGWMALGLPGLDSPFYAYIIFAPLALGLAVMLSILFSERVERPLWRKFRRKGTQAVAEVS